MSGNERLLSQERQNSLALFVHLGMFIAFPILFGVLAWLLISVAGLQVASNVNAAKLSDLSFQIGEVSQTVEYLREHVTMKGQADFNGWKTGNK
ncbi:MAG: hypothetical protein ACREBW_10100 [Candidatus Micrarchaeaceae archaeon]